MAENIFEGGVGGFLTNLGASFNKQMNLDKQLAEGVLAENQKLATMSEGYSQAADATAKNLQAINAQQAEAKRLATSENIFDRIQLVGEQILNPRGFTSEGRTKAKAELTQDLNLQGQILGAQASASEMRVGAMKAEHALATLGVNEGMLKVRAMTEGYQAAAAGLQAQETLRTASLAPIQVQDITKALAGPKLPNGNIELNGFEYTPTELRERSKALDVREKLSLLGPQLTDPEYMQKLAIHQEMTLSTMTAAEMEEVRRNGYVMPDGTQVSSGVWMSEWTRANQADSMILERKTNEFILQNQVPKLMEEGQQFLQQTSEYAVPGSPITAARTEYQSAMAIAAQIAEAEPTPAGKLKVATLLSKAKEGYIQSIEKEASRKAGGNKDVTDIFFKQMTGQPVPIEQISDVIRSRYIKREGFTNVIPGDLATKLRVSADEIANKLRISQAKDMSFDNAKMTDVQLREEAFNQAFEKMRGSIGTDIANQVQTNLSNRTDNPAIKAGLLPAQLTQQRLAASQMARDRIKQSYGLTDGQVASLMSGDYDAIGKNPNDIKLMLDEFNAESTMAEYELLENTRPGLGFDMAQWYAREVPRMADTYVKGLDPIQQAIAGDRATGAAEELTMHYTRADEAITNRREQTIKQMQIGVKKPENSWMLMLNMTPGLADSERQSLYYDVVMPAVKVARGQGADDQTASQAAFDALNSYKTDDKTVNSAIRSFQRDLPNIIDNFEKLWGATVNIDNNNAVVFGRMQQATQQSSDRLKKFVPWIK